jgi:hypothetical protein
MHDERLIEIERGAARISKPALPNVSLLTVPHIYVAVA